MLDYILPFLYIKVVRSRRTLSIHKSSAQYESLHMVQYNLLCTLIIDIYKYRYYRTYKVVLAYGVIIMLIVT